MRGGAIPRAFAFFRTASELEAAAAEMPDNFQALPLENPIASQRTEPLDLADIRNSLKSLMWRAAGVTQRCADSTALRMARRNATRLTSCIEIDSATS